MIHAILLYALLGLGVAFCWLGAIGVLAARDAYARLQFIGPVSTLASVCFVAAIWICDSAWQARLKASVIALLLIGGSAIVSHVTARAFYVRQIKGWDSANLPPAEESS